MLKSSSLTNASTSMFLNSLTLQRLDAFETTTCLICSKRIDYYRTSFWKRRENFLTLAFNNSVHASASEVGTDEAIYVINAFVSPTSLPSANRPVGLGTGHGEGDAISTLAA